ncbi:MAG: SDR family NAD(P)-dependent oxidoreductase [Myxococcota bacterium]
MELARTTWLITGASAGIGAALARVAAREGASHLVLVARRGERLEALAAELTTGRVGLRVTVVPVDLATDEGRRALLERLTREGVEVDVLVNNAGVGAHGLFDEIPPERTRQMVELNVVALTELSAALVPGMVRRRRGGVVNVSSVVGLMPVPSMAVYAATKAYVTSLSDAMAAELHSGGVTVVCVHPGPTTTEFQGVADPQGRRRTKAPAPFFQSAEQVAEAAVAGLRRGRVRVNPGVNQVVSSLARLMPAPLARALGRRMARQERARGRPG